MTQPRTLPSRRTPAQVAEAFLTPRRPTRATPAFLPEARQILVDGPIGKVAGRLLGDGPCVVLLHRWEGAASELASFVPPLLDAGLSVLALDLPAHGASEGERVSIPLAAQALCDVQRAMGAGQVFHGGIGHSLGAAILVHAMWLGCRVGRAALIAAPAHAVDYARDYCLRDGLDAAESEQMLDLMHSRYGVDVRAVSMPDQAASLSQPALFIHSADDRVIPIAASRLSAQQWRGAQHITVEDLGHARLLRDATVVDHVVRFMRTT